MKILRFFTKIGWHESGEAATGGNVSREQRYLAPSFLLSEVQMRRVKSQIQLWDVSGAPRLERARADEADEKIGCLFPRAGIRQWMNRRRVGVLSALPPAGFLKKPAPLVRPLMVGV